jgi:hypothetical protein
MALTYGFYNSQNGDRVYDADQFSSFLDGIVYDGVYEAVGDKFYVTSLEDEDLTIQVGAGRAWLKHTWTLNDTNLYLNATAALDVYDRIDAVVLEVDKEIRTNSIKIIEGTPSDATPARPDLKNEDNIRQYPLAYIYREHGTTTIPNTHAGTLETDAESATECIKFMVGSSSMPLCSALALAGVPSGGKIGQVLAKESSESGAVGWHSIDALPYDVWYLSDGVSEDNVIAAFKFCGRISEAEALKNINQNNTYYLTKSSTLVTWASATGVYVPSATGLNNSSLYTATNIQSVILRYSLPNNTTTVSMVFTNSKSGANSSGFAIYPNTPFATQGFYYRKTGTVGFRIGGLDTRASTTATEVSGVIGFNCSASYALYFDGAKYSTSVPSDSTGSKTADMSITHQGLLIGRSALSEGSASSTYALPYKWGSQGPFNLQYLAIYSVALTANQHKTIYNAINSDYINVAK